jgi:hypothetical protein
MAQPFFIVKTLSSGEAAALRDAIRANGGDITDPIPFIATGDIAPNGGTTLPLNTLSWTLESNLSPISGGGIVASGYSIDVAQAVTGSAPALTMTAVQKGITTEAGNDCGRANTYIIEHDWQFGDTWNTGEVVTADNPAVAALGSPGTVALYVTACGVPCVADVQTITSHGIKSTNTVTAGPNFLAPFGAVFPCEPNEQAGTAGPLPIAPSFSLQEGALYAAVFEIVMPVHRVSIGGGISFPGAGPSGTLLPDGPGPVPGPEPVSLPAMPCGCYCFNQPR